MNLVVHYSFRFSLSNSTALKPLLAFVDYSSAIFVIILATLIPGKELTLKKIIAVILVFSALVLLAL